MLASSNALTVETDLATNELAWQAQSFGRCTSAAAAKKFARRRRSNCRKEYELAVWKKEDFLQQSRFALCNCRVCNRPFAVQKRD